MEYYGNMGPFNPVSFKGNARFNATPVFIKQLPLTIGGLAGEDVKFGRVVSVDPTTNRRQFVMGIPDGYVMKGIAMFDPSIGVYDPAMQNYYFAGRPMTATTMGILEIREYDLTQSSPAEGSTVWANNTTGEIAFNDGTDLSSSGYTQLNAYVYETLDPNGAKVAFGMPCLTVTQTRETTETTATPVVDPAAGAIESGTQVTLTCDTAEAVIYYTLDGTDPIAVESPVYSAPITITSAVTLKAIAVAPGYDPSETLEAAYTIA